MGKFQNNTGKPTGQNGTKDTGYFTQILIYHGFGVFGIISIDSDFKLWSTLIISDMILSKRKLFLECSDLGKFTHTPFKTYKNFPNFYWFVYKFYRNIITNTKIKHGFV
jgi:hypothetical protein